MSKWAKERLEGLVAGARTALGHAVDPDEDLSAASAGAALDDRGRAKLEALSAGVRGVACRVTKVKKMAGDASIAVVRRKKRFLFDYDASLEFEAVVTPGQVKYKGTLDYPELSSAVSEGEPYECQVTYKSGRAPPSGEKAAVDLAVAELRDAVAATVAVFVSEYQALP